LNIKDIPIPQQLQKFPLFHGYPVHYTVFVDANGKPNFKVMHEHRRIECFNKNLCHLCGEDLGDGPFAFIGGPMCVKAHRFVDGPMGIECAEYAAIACPFLSSPDGKYASIIPVSDGDKIVSYENVSNVRPSKMALVVGRSYKVQRNGYDVHVSGPHANNPYGGGQLVCVVGQYSRCDWNIMPSSEEK